ncbi:MAG: DUF4954 family protein [Rikenellaceae bacterium]|nr:DUF4954 family protein [Rikenellaceae bacterium]
MRQLTHPEIVAVEQLGCTAEDWSQILVSDDFRPEQLNRCRLRGRVEVESGAYIYNSSIANYRIGRNTRIEQVGELSCRHESTFGNGTKVATMNENGGRTVLICDTLSAQVAYMMAIYRHRPQLIAALEAMVEHRSEELRDTMGQIGEGCTITGCRILREVRIGKGVTIDGASILENGTLCDDCRIGVDVKAYDFIVAEGAQIANGVIVERCFIGESCIFDKGFTAADSLFFANSHCENGEAAAIFAGPYTVSHHKSTLLIAGMFSFFNAGSAANQSNHLFKSGAVHQAVHPRGCKFASGSYIMAPAAEGAFTMVMGRHSRHHDTSAFPYSYLLEKEDRSFLLPAVNLTSYGTVRDLEKWPARDRRTHQRDIINFDVHNPYTTWSILRAVEILHSLEEQNPDSPVYSYNRVQIRAAALHRGLTLYNRAVVAAMGAMLEKGSTTAQYNGAGRWVDMAGQYIAKSAVEQLIESIEQGQYTSLKEVDNFLRIFFIHYDDYAHSWAEHLYASLLGHAPSQEEIQEAIEAGKAACEKLNQTTENDRRRDCAPDMAVGYGVDCDTVEERMADFKHVRGLF